MKMMTDDNQLSRSKLPAIITFTLCATSLLVYDQYQGNYANLLLNALLSNL